MKKEQNRKIKTQDKKTKIDKRNSKILQLKSKKSIIFWKSLYSYISNNLGINCFGKICNR